MAYPRDRTEKKAAGYAKCLAAYIERHGGRFVRDEDRGLQIILEGRRIPINFDRANTALAGLIVEACDVTTISQPAQAAIQRLQIMAAEKAARMRMCRFSASSTDEEAIYIPLANGHLLCIGPDSFEEVSNGENGESLWIEHPYDEPFEYALDDPSEGLALFERLVVETQACVRPDTKWLVGMHAGLFPYIRTFCSARFILQIRGPSQNGGKTSGMQRFTILHGLGDVKGDCSVAALSNEGDIGLQVLDNKEQANFEQSLIDYCLFLATGAQRQRSTADGKVRTSRGRPVGVITTIEGAPKQEVQARIVTVDYRVSGEKIGRGDIEKAIRQNRHKILSALTWVLARYLAIRRQRETPHAMPDFQENFQADADLLRAFGEIADKPKGWAEPIIAGWAAAIGEQEPEENELEHPIFRAVKEGLSCRSINLTRDGKQGKLYVTTCGELLTALQKLNPQDKSLPKTPEGLGRRLRNRRFCSFEVIDEGTAPNIPELRRRGRARPIGVFFPCDR